MLLEGANKIRPIYTPHEEKAMHVVVFGSGSGTNLEALLRFQRENDSLFEIKALFTDRECRFQEIAEREGIPLIHHSFVDFFKRNGFTDYKNTVARTEYEEKNVALLKGCARANHFSIDLILLAGYMRLLFPPMLKEFPNKIINVHPADLTIITDKGKPKYAGSHAVLDALKQGETRTRSSVILVDEEVDEGPILVSGPWLTYNEGFPVTVKRAACHQEKQKVFSDWVATTKAISLIAEGRIALDKRKKVYYDGHPTERGGVIINIEE